MNIKSIQKEDCAIRWMGCEISWWSPCAIVRDSSFVPSIVRLSLVHQTEHLALKSLKKIVNKALWIVVSLKIVSKFDRKSGNSIASWLGDLYTTPI